MLAADARDDLLMDRPAYQAAAPSPLQCLVPMIRRISAAK